MTTQPELDFRPRRRRYPHTPGFKAAGGTSEEAARAMRSRAATLRARVLEKKPMTADEVASAMGESVLAVRPRVSELKTLGRIEATRERHDNRSGKRATVWRLCAAGVIHGEGEV